MPSPPGYAHAPEAPRWPRRRPRARRHCCCPPPGASSPDLGCHPRRSCAPRWTSTAEATIRGFRTIEPGLRPSLVEVGPAWELLEARVSLLSTLHRQRRRWTPPCRRYLQTPGYGTGLYDREGGLTVGRPGVIVPRPPSPAPRARRRRQFRQDDCAGRRTTAPSGSTVPPLVRLPLNQPVAVKITAEPRSAGVHSALLNVDNPLTRRHGHTGRGGPSSSSLPAHGAGVRRTR